MPEAKNNPWVICRSSVGTGDNAKYEECVLAVKKKMGLHKDMTEAQYLAIMKFGEAEIEIFEDGTHRGRRYTKADLEQIVRNFNDWGKTLIQPPLVLGHDEDQAILKNSGLPAAGWLTSVVAKQKPNGRTVLVGQFTDVPEVVRKAVQKRAYKRISSEIYEDFANDNLDGGKAKGLAIRRIALLGADIPEVKTLADVVAFGEGTDKFLYAEHEEETMDQAQIEAMIKNAVTAERAEADKRFSAFQEAQKTELQALKDKNAQLEKDNASLSQAHAVGLLERRSQAIASFLEVQKEKGRILPAWETMGLKKFMESLDDKKILKYGEGDKATEMSTLSFFQEFLKALPPVVKFGAMTEDDLEKISATKGVDQGAGATVNMALTQAAKKYMEDEKKAGRVVTYAEALHDVAVARPELVGTLKK